MAASMPACSCIYPPFLWALWCFAQQGAYANSRKEMETKLGDMKGGKGLFSVTLINQSISQWEETQNKYFFQVSLLYLQKCISFSENLQNLHLLQKSVWNVKNMLLYFQHANSIKITLTFNLLLLLTVWTFLLKKVDHIWEEVYFSCLVFIWLWGHRLVFCTREENKLKKKSHCFSKGKIMGDCFVVLQLKEIKTKSSKAQKKKIIFN